MQGVWVINVICLVQIQNKTSTDEWMKGSSLQNDISEKGTYITLTTSRGHFRNNLVHTAQYVCLHSTTADAESMHKFQVMGSCQHARGAFNFKTIVLQFFWCMHKHYNKSLALLMCTTGSCAGTNVQFWHHTSAWAWLGLGFFIF